MEAKPSPSRVEAAVEAPEVGDRPTDAARPARKAALPIGFAIGYFVLLGAFFAQPLYDLLRYALGSELHSHIILVPFISAYLLNIRRDSLPKVYHMSPLPAAVFLVLGIFCWIGSQAVAAGGAKTSHGDSLSLVAVSFICCVVAGAFVTFGAAWVKAALFPVAFLLFLVPLPHATVEWLEDASKVASASAAELFFMVTSTPFLRDDQVFQLPGITIEVARECSGIRSSWVLLITSVLGANLFLRSGWRRLALVLFVIPLGILRNGFRILAIGLLCVNLGPHMIDSIIHRRGGPLFFALSLIPLFAVLWWMRRSERNTVPVPRTAPSSS